MKVIAHRGASGTHVENTLVAFEQAIIEGCDGIELDVQLHPSGELVLSHDAYVMFNGQVKPLNALSLTEVASITFHDGSKLTTLDAALIKIAGRCDVNIEIKSASLYSEQHPKGQVEQVLLAIDAIVRKLVAQEIYSWQQLSISSFNHHVLQKARNLIPEINLGALSASCPVNYATFAKELSATSVNLAIDCINQDMIDHAHSQGLFVWVYTVNTPEDIKWCMSLGVDGIFTDFPKQSRQVIEKLGSSI